MGAQQHVKTFVLTRTMADALQRVHDRGPAAWDEGRGRAGGAVSRMFDRMASFGLVSKPPYFLTEIGRAHV